MPFLREKQAAKHKLRENKRKSRVKSRNMLKNSGRKSDIIQALKRGEISRERRRVVCRQNQKTKEADKK